MSEEVDDIRVTEAAEDFKLLSGQGMCFFLKKR